MRCPNCRSEVANDAVCPYCGAVVYQQAEPVRRSGTRSGGRNRELERRLRALENRLAVSTVLQCGTFVMTVLILVVLALQ